MKDKSKWLMLVVAVWVGVAMFACQCSRPVVTPTRPVEPQEEPTEAQEEEPPETYREEPPEVREEPLPQTYQEEPPEVEPASDQDVWDDLAEELRLDVVTYRGEVLIFRAPPDLPSVQVDVSAGDCHSIWVWGFPFDETVHLRLYHPSGQFVAAHDETLELGEPDCALKVVQVWLGGRPTGNWLVRADSGGPSASTSFYVSEPERPTLSIALEEAGPFITEENGCGVSTYAPGAPVVVFGAGFPPGQRLPLGIYYQRETEPGAELIDGLAVQADDQGRFEVHQAVEAIAEEGRGTYLATVVIDPSAPHDGPRAVFRVGSAIGVPGREVALDLGICGGDFSDARLQRAVLAGVNRSNLSDYVGGVPVKLQVYACGRAMDGSKEPRDAELARELLAQAGYRDGLRAYLVYPDRDVELAEAAKYMARDLGLIGSSAEVVPVPRRDLDAKVATMAAAGEPVLWLVRR